MKSLYDFTDGRSPQAPCRYALSELDSEWVRIPEMAVRLGIKTTEASKMQCSVRSASVGKAPTIDIPTKSRRPKFTCRTARAAPARILRQV